MSGNGTPSCPLFDSLLPKGVTGGLEGWANKPIMSWGGKGKKPGILGDLSKINQECWAAAVEKNKAPSNGGPAM
jgi:hypothetical protein